MYHEIRKKRILDSINLNKNGLEIGALCWPLITPEDTRKIQYVDHTDTAELKKVYRNDKGVNLDAIVNVDYPLKGRLLRETVGKKRFAYIVASHVIEHVPDVVGWLQDMSSVLHDGGRLALAVPDKRYTFDIDREPSTVGDIVGPFIERRQTPYASRIFDHAAAYRLSIDSTAVWRGELYLNSRAPHKFSLHQAYMTACDSAKGEYVDAHISVFTPNSFFEVLKSLIELGLTDFKVHSFYDTEPGEYEFIVILEKASKNIRTQVSTLPRLSAPRPRRSLEPLISALEAENNQLSAEIAMLRASLSWRFTRPLRKAAGIARIVRQKLRQRT